MQILVLEISLSRQHKDQRFHSKMLSLIRSLAPPLLSLIILIMASGLFNTFVSIRLELEGYSNETIGIVTSALYLGILAGSLKIDKWIARVGHIRAFVILAALITIFVLAQAFWVQPWYWCVMRFLIGVCTGGIFIVIESWLLLQSTQATRGKILSVYLGAFYGAMSGGQFLINLSDPRGFYPFCITAFLSAISILPILVTKLEEPKIKPEAIRIQLSQLFRISPLGFIGGIISGMLLAVVYGLVPVYAKENGMSISEIGTLMAVIIFGGLCLQWPMGHLADIGNRRRVLNAASFLTACFAVAIALVDHLHPSLLLTLAWFFGGFSFTIYPLSMAFACEKLEDHQIISATGCFVLSYGMGAIVGPLIAPLAMNAVGASGLFYFLATITLFLGLIGLKKPCNETFS